MSSKSVDFNEALSHLPEMVSLVKSGTEIVVTEGDTPVARVVPLAPDAAPRVPGLHPGAIWTSDDFDAPLPGELFTA